MISPVAPILLGIMMIVLGICNMKGTISSIHWYHRRRVKEEDRMPFGRMVGSGTIVIGAFMVLFGCFSFAAEKFQNDLYASIGSVLMAAGVVVGLALSFYAMVKYNKGIF